MLAGAGTLGDNAIPGDPGSLDAFARQLSTAADDISQIQARLTSNTLGGAWSGSAADAFRSHLNELPSEIGKIGSSFSQAATTIMGFAGELGGYQQTAEWLAGKIQDAEQAARQAQAAHDSAHRSLLDAKQAHGAAQDPVSKSLAQRTLDRATSVFASAQNALDGANGELTSLQQRAAANHHAWQDAGTACAQQVEGLIGGHIDHGFGAWVEHTVGHIAHDVNSWVISPVTRWAGREMDQHWEAVRGFLSDYSTALGIVGGVIEGVGVVVAMTGVGAPVGAAIFAVGDGVSDVGGGVDALVLAGDEIEAARGNKKDLARLPGDVLIVGVDFLPGGKIEEKLAGRIAGRMHLAAKLGDVGEKLNEKLGQLASRTHLPQDLEHLFKTDGRKLRPAARDAVRLGKNVFEQVVADPARNAANRFYQEISEPRTVRCPLPESAPARP